MPAHTLRAERSFALLWFLQGFSIVRQCSGAWGASNIAAKASIDRNWRNVTVCCAAASCRSNFLLAFGGFRLLLSKAPGTVFLAAGEKSILLFTSLFTIPLAGQCGLNALFFTGLQVVGVTLDFLDNVLRLYLPLEPAQRIFQRFAFLYANLSQNFHLQTCLKGSYDDNRLLICSQDLSFP
jgi:hypothetical protein